MATRVRYRSRISEIASDIKPRVHRAAKLTAEAISEGAKARVSERTRKLHDAIHVEPEGSDAYLVVAGDKDAWYGHLVEHGAAPHKIPNAFGQGVTVEHPGAAPHPFLIPAAEAQRESFEAEVRAALKGL